MPTHHELNATPETVRWGYFEAVAPSVIEIESGDSITIHTVSGGPDVVPDGDLQPLPELVEIHRQVHDRMTPGHILTGPVAVRGAKAGDVLEIRILDVQLADNWGWNVIRPLTGALPDDFDETRLLHIPLDRSAMTGRLPWGHDLPLHPFFGVMGVAPPPGWGRISSIIPRRHGGNLDCKELRPGSTLYLPVFVDGALFSTGDGHATQGDGEVCVTAIETALTGTFELHLRKDMDLDAPFAETRSHYITFGIDPDLDVAAEQALRRMLDQIQSRTNLSKADAYTLCSLAGDLRVTQVVNVHKGIHMMLPKSALHG